MAVKVIKNKVFDGNKTYEVGDVIMGLSENEESQLVSDEIVEYVYTKQEMKQDSTDNDTNKEDENLADDIDEKGDIADKEEEVESIDIDSLVLNPDEYVKSSSSKNKKEKIV